MKKNSTCSSSQQYFDNHAQCHPWFLSESQFLPPIPSSTIMIDDSTPRTTTSIGRIGECMQEYEPTSRIMMYARPPCIFIIAIIILLFAIQNWQKNTWWDWRLLMNATDYYQNHLLRHYPKDRSFIRCHSGQRLLSHVGKRKETTTGKICCTPQLMRHWYLSSSLRTQIFDTE